MDEKEFKERVTRLNEVAKVIEKLPVEIRAIAFPFLEEYIAGKQNTSKNGGSSHKPAKSSEHESNGDQSRDEFLAAFNHEKPSDNVYLLIASLYREYGTEPFTIKELQQLGTDTGVTLPERIDMTIKAAKSKGKILFTAVSRGRYKPTVHGEAYLKETYKITKGKNKKESAE